MKKKTLNEMFEALNGVKLENFGNGEESSVHTVPDDFWHDTIIDTANAIIKAGNDILVQGQGDDPQNEQWRKKILKQSLQKAIQILG